MRGLLSLALLLTVVIAVPFVPPTADEELAIQAIAEAFLRGYAEYTLMYEDADLIRDTVLDPTVSGVPVSSRTYLLSAGVASVSDMQENISFITEKAKYFSEVRQLGGITRHSLELTYVFTDVDVSGNAAVAKASELASFWYTGQAQQSFCRTSYVVDLIRVGGRWLVADVTDGNWYDGQHKQDRTFNAREELARLKLTVAQNPASGVSGQSPEITPRTDTYGRIPYSAENAIAYAQTYVRNSNSPLTPFYNQSLWSWPEFDCMNFASQCIWAGFSGNQMRAAIDAHDIPMDKGGAAVWYSCSRSKADGARYSTASWRSCSSFRAYIGRSNAATDVGLKAKVVNVGDGLPFSGVTETELRGAIAHVDGAAGPLGHAIVITAADGLARNQVYFSSHTRDSENALLWDYYPAGPIRIFVPEYFRTKASIDNALRVTMLRPVAQNSTQVVSCSTNANQYKFTIQITAPSGTTTGSSVYNATSCSHSYQFSEAGTYRVTCYSKTTQSRAAQSVTFYVVSGESRTLVSPAKPPEDTAGMSRKSAPEIRAGGSPILGSRLAHVMKP